MAEDTRPDNPVLKAISHHRRRVILALLRDRRSPLSEEKVALTLGGRELEKPPRRVTSEETRAILADLRHAQLPCLDERGLVTWNQEEATVTTTDHPAFDDSKLHRLLDLDEAGMDGVLTVISDATNRLVLRLLKDHGRPMSRRELAEEVLRSKRSRADPDPVTLNEAATRLNHSRLPALEEADLINYSSETGTTTYANHPALEAVFSVLYSDSRLLDRMDGFFAGLSQAAEETAEQIGSGSDLPESWHDPYHG